MGNLLSSDAKESATAQPSQDDAFSSMKKASTFDERHLASSNRDPHQFVPLVKKSFTVVGYDGERQCSVTEPRKFTADDVLYRRYFNLHKDPSKAMEKIPSLAGMIFDDKEVACEAVSKGVVVVDTFSTGALLAHHVIQKGYKCVCVLSFKNDKLLEMIPKGLDLKSCDHHSRRGPGGD